MKYNPNNVPNLSKGKMVQKAGYIKGTIMDKPEEIAALLLEGGQAHLTSQTVLSTGVQMIEIKIYFVPTT